MVSEAMRQLGAQGNPMRVLFEYGKQREAIVGPENVFDFALGNPSVPPPARVNEVIRELEQPGCTILQEWQQSPWLRGELFLLLDREGKGTLRGYRLQYTKEDGLCIEKEGKHDRDSI